LTYQEKQIKIWEATDKNTDTKTSKFCKVQWSHHTKEEATWEHGEKPLRISPIPIASLFETRGR
jgi:hypothetical protein